MNGDINRLYIYIVTSNLTLVRIYQPISGDFTKNNDHDQLNKLVTYNSDIFDSLNNAFDLGLQPQREVRREHFGHGHES